MSTTNISNEPLSLSEQRKKLIQDIMSSNEAMLLLSNQIVAEGFRGIKEQKRTMEEKHVYC